MLDRTRTVAEVVGQPAIPVTLQEQLPLVCNVPDDVLFANMHAAQARGLPIIEAIPPHDEIAVICGGGPSLGDDIETIREMQQHGCKIFALNNVGHFLLELGVTADALVVLDAREHNSRFVKGLSAQTTLYIATQCAPETFEAVTAGAQVITWHAPMDGKSGLREHRKTVLIGEGTVVGVRALRLVHVLGYREIHLFGMDSSFKDGQAHAYPQPENDADLPRECSVGDEKFTSTAWMIRQAEDLQNLSVSLMGSGTLIGVHGSGLFPSMIRELIVESNGQEVARGETPTLMTLFYDLHVCPPGYDFLTTLAFAEQARINAQLDALKVVVVPGPYHGFRDDGAAPLDPEHRRQMLWGVLLGLCRCMPSVKEIVLASSRDEAARHVSENIYPEDYTIEHPVARYGITNAIEGMRRNDLARFEAPQWARDQIAKWIKPNTVTITLRETHYAVDRNTDPAIWLAAANRLRDAGHNVVLIRDTEYAFGDGLDGHQTFHPASYDMALRLALYEAATINCFPANGPWTLGLFAKRVDMLAFGLCREGPHNLTPVHWQSRGMPVGSQFPHTHGRVKIVWEPESADLIVSEVNKRLERGKKPLPFYACYDLGKLPANFDAATWLVNAEMDRIREGIEGPLRVAFKPGPNGGFRADGLPHDPNERNAYLDNIVRPMLPMIGAVEDDGALDGRPYSYFMRDVSANARRGALVPRFKASALDVLRVGDWMKANDVSYPLIFTLREAAHWQKRNSNLEAWVEFAKTCGEEVIFVRDTEKAGDPLEDFLTCPEASRDLGFRQALYERAQCNMLVGSGPVMMLIFSDAPFMFFRPLMDPKTVDGWPAGTPEWWRDNVGVRVGSQFPWAKENQRIVWATEDLADIRTAWNNFKKFDPRRTTRLHLTG
jgi:hypothetical protein